MQSVSSRIWTRVAVSISYDDNYYTTGTLTYYISFASFGTQSSGYLKYLRYIWAD